MQKTWHIVLAQHSNYVLAVITAITTTELYSWYHAFSVSSSLSLPDVFVKEVGHFGETQIGVMMGSILHRWPTGRVRTREVIPDHIWSQTGTGSPIPGCFPISWRLGNCYTSGMILEDKRIKATHKVSQTNHNVKYCILLSEWPYHVPPKPRYFGKWKTLYWTGFQEKRHKLRPSTHCPHPWLFLL